MNYFMNKTNKYYLGVGIIGLLITTLAVSGLVKAADIDGQQQTKKQSSQNHSEIILAIENNDYQAWQQAVGEDSLLLEKINQENWGKFVEMHSHRKAARQIAEELDIKQPVNFQQFKHKAGKLMKMRDNQAARQAITDKDYQAWLEAVGSDSPIAQKITEDNFSQFVQAHSLLHDNNYEAAKEIFDSLGLKQPKLQAEQ